MTTLYELLGVDRKASTTDIRKTFRKLCKTAHPDQGGDSKKFMELTEAYEILIDPQRRARYDATGSTRPSPVTPKRIGEIIEQSIRQAVDAMDASGNTDDPTLVNVRDKILKGMEAARRNVRDSKYKLQRKLERAQRMLERFKPNKDADDFVGDALRKRLAQLKDELQEQEDAIELSLAVEDVFKTYGYEVGPRPEGQHSQGPTTRRSGVLFIGVRSDDHF